MSQMTDFTLPSCVPGRTLHAFRCVPEGEVRAILQLSHGMVEFIDRYKPLAEYLAANEMVRNVRYPGASSSPATTIWATAALSAPRQITAISPSPTATAPSSTTSTLSLR